MSPQQFEQGFMFVRTISLVGGDYFTIKFESGTQWNYKTNIVKIFNNFLK
jgi:hypothetical protein